MTPTGNNEKALEIIESLIMGLDPETNEALPKSSVLNRSDVLRAFLAATAALEQVMARSARRAMLPSGVGRTWTDEEEQQLRAMFEDKAPVEAIAEKHRRTVRAIEARLEKIGLITSDQRTTNTIFMDATPSRRKRRKTVRKQVYHDE
jgi:hypothetical protein